jgi:hypothetical protein
MKRENDAPEAPVKWLSELHALLIFNMALIIFRV